MFSKSHGKTFVTESNKTRSSSTQQRASTGRFAALINNNAIINTDQDDFLPSTQTQTKSIKRKSAPSSTYVKPVEPTKRTKKSNLFQDVVSTSHLTLYENTIKPIPPWLNLPFGKFDVVFIFLNEMKFRNSSTHFLVYSGQIFVNASRSSLSSMEFGN